MPVGGVSPACKYPTDYRTPSSVGCLVSPAARFDFRIAMIAPMFQPKKTAVIHRPISFSNSFSVSTLTFNSRALSSLEPGSAPART